MNPLLVRLMLVALRQSPKMYTDSNGRSIFTGIKSRMGAPGPANGSSLSSGLETQTLCCLWLSHLNIFKVSLPFSSEAAGKKWTRRLPDPEVAHKATLKFFHACGGLGPGG